MVNIPKSKLYSEDGTLNIHLYHGTSTLFLDSILKHGLAGVNPVKEWELVELCNEVYTIYLQCLLRGVREGCVGHIVATLHTTSPKRTAKPERQRQ